MCGVNTVYCLWTCDLQSVVFELCIAQSTILDCYVSFYADLIILNVHSQGQLFCIIACLVIVYCIVIACVSNAMSCDVLYACVTFVCIVTFGIP